MGNRAGGLPPSCTSTCKPLPKRLSCALFFVAAYVCLVSGIHNCGLSLRTPLKG